jgi:hypothetical protein
MTDDDLTPVPDVMTSFAALVPDVMTSFSSRGYTAKALGVSNVSKIEKKPTGSRDDANPKINLGFLALPLGSQSHKTSSPQNLIRWLQTLSLQTGNL